jgi:sugar lactone lactonase YvrE
MRRLALATTLCGLCLLAGCSGGSLTTANLAEPEQSASAIRLTGAVHGGQQPIVGAHVYLLAANTTGYGNASVSLLTNVSGSTTLDTTLGAATNGDYYVTTDGSGTFSISSDYSCTAGQQVYLYALGGDAGSGPNSSAGLLAVLGNCPGGTFSTATFIDMNEVSTIAAAYALSGFASSATSVSSSSTSLAATGVKNAFAIASNLETLSTGVALATTPVANGGNGTVPQTEINSLANILADCINSNGAVTGPTSPTACYTLFTNTLSGGTTGAQPTNTATAAINIAHNPGVNVANLFPLQVGVAPFQPALTTAPNDFTIAISYTATSLNICNGVAIDASGDAWISNGNGADLTKLSPLGTPLSGATGYTGGGLTQPTGIAIDPTGNVWAVNENPNTISEFTSSGVAATNSPFGGGGLNGPTDIAIDASGDIWATNSAGASVSELSSAGAPKSPATTGFAGGGLQNPHGIAIDLSAHVWVTNTTSSTITELDSSGGVISAISGDGMSDPDGIAIDASGNVWSANLVGNNSDGFFTELNSSGANESGTLGFSGGGLDFPYSMAIDGSGNLWAYDLGARLSELNSSGVAVSGSSGYKNTSLGNPGAIAIDGSGNLWATNETFGANNVVEFIGIATPVVTPVVANLITPYGSHAVNVP